MLVGEEDDDDEEEDEADPLVVMPHGESWPHLRVHRWKSQLSSLPHGDPHDGRGSKQSLRSHDERREGSD